MTTEKKSPREIADKLFPGAHFATIKMVTASRASSHFPKDFEDSDIAYYVDAEVIRGLKRKIDDLIHELDVLHEAEMHSPTAVGQYGEE